MGRLGGKRAVDPAENSLALSLPPTCERVSVLGQSRDEQVKERVAEKVSHIGQTWEQVWTRDRETEAAGRAVEVGKRQRHCAGHRQLEAANCGRGQRLGESVGSLVAGRDVDEAEGALVDDFVA